ncbi:MAG: VOC family protein [Actinomycetota bacterium]|nr:VOC family protein [Actinomycetota bacterium]
MNTVSGLSHILVRVSDVDRAVRFYVDVFGLEERYRADNGVVYLRIPGSAQHIAFCDDANAGGSAHRFGLIRAGTSDVDPLLELVRARGGSLVRCRRLAPGVVEVVVADPDGNVISLSLS